MIPAELEAERARAQTEAAPSAEPVGMFVGVRIDPPKPIEFYGEVTGRIPQEKCLLYTAPPDTERLRALLREALEICHLGDGDTDLHKRIRAALGEE